MPDSASAKGAQASFGGEHFWAGSLRMVEDKGLATDEVRALTPTEFARFVRDEMATNKTLVQNAGIQPE